MSEEDNRQPLTRNRFWSTLFGLINSDLLALILEAWQLLRKVSGERAVGLYEVLDFEHTLELCDAKGKKAIDRKRETVRLLQDHVSAYVDQVWGRGEIFADYRCSLGVPVDRYRDGKYWCVLISLREVRRRGDTLRISIDRTVKNGFPHQTDLVDTVVRHRTRRFRMAVIFPKERPPHEAALVEDPPVDGGLGALERAQSFADGRAVDIVPEPTSGPVLQHAMELDHRHLQHRPAIAPKLIGTRA